MIPSITAHLAGIGLDIIYIHRIQNAYDRHGDRFIRRILGEQEILKFNHRYGKDPQRGIRFLATRFAAKEAFSKAIGLGIHAPMRWSDVQTLNKPSGQPTIVLSGALRPWCEQRFGAIHVSITDESDLAQAFVMVESKKE